MSAPTVSVIIPCYKMGRYVGEALESIGAQTYSQWEVIVVDDAGPEDGTREAVANFARRFPEHRVEYVRHEKNRGVSGARNTAIRQATGKFLAFLDPDDVWLPEKLAKQMAVLESHKDAVLCYSQARLLKLSEGMNYAPGIEISGTPPANETADAILGVASGKLMFAMSTLVMRKDIVERAGGFDETLKLGEDRLLIGSGVLFGAMTWVPEALCVYRVHDASATASIIKDQIASFVELDLCARLALWLRRQTGGRKIGSRIVEELFLARLRNTLGMPSWFRSRGRIFKMLVKLTMSYPGSMALLMGQLLVQFPMLALRRSWRRYAGKARA